MSKVSFLKIGQTPRSDGQGHGIKWKVVPLGIHICNMKALPPTNQKLWARLKFLKNRSNSKAKGQRVKVMVSNERSYHKEYTCEIWRPYHLLI
jgi:hypothetical protein